MRKMRPLKICLLNLDFVPSRSSGLAVYGETLAAGLVRAGHQVTVIAALRQRLAEQEMIDGIRVYRVPLGRGDWLSYAWHAGPLAFALNQEEAFDIVHFLDAHFAYHYTGPFIASVFQSFRQRATSDGGLPYHSNWTSLGAHLLYYHAARWLAEAPAVHRASHLIASSRATAGEFVAHYGVQSERITVVPLGIDLTRFQRRDAFALREHLGMQNTKVLMYVGFGTPRKGLDYLARAMSLLSSDARLVLIGRWERAYRSKFYRALGAAQDRVIEIGYVPDEDLPLYYSLADILVFPSLLEGFGLPLVEAMACHTPIIASQVGSVPEILGPGGRLVPPRNPMALASAIDELLQDDTLRHAMGEAGSSWVMAQFGQERMVRETLAVYNRYIPDRP
jgi:glycosyltransferase involved in cell wall biosynthesis